MKRDPENVYLFTGIGLIASLKFISLAFIEMVESIRIVMLLLCGILSKHNH